MCSIPNHLLFLSRTTIPKERDAVVNAIKKLGFLQTCSLGLAKRHLQFRSSNIQPVMNKNPSVAFEW